jgi:transposase-like protein
VRLDDQKLCLLVMIGVRADGRKELVALTDGYREAAESWADLLRDCRRRGMRAPVLAAGDGALGFWSALREVFPETREQRCWFHKVSNVLAALPKSVHPGAKKALAEIWNAEDKSHARDAVKEYCPLVQRRTTRDHMAVHRLRPHTPASPTCCPDPGRSQGPPRPHRSHPVPPVRAVRI